MWKRQAAIVKQIRTDLKLSRSRFAKMIGMDGLAIAQNVANWESASQGIPVKYLPRICEVGGIPSAIMTQAITDDHRERIEMIFKGAGK